MAHTLTAAPPATDRLREARRLTGLSGLGLLVSAVLLAFAPLAGAVGALVCAIALRVSLARAADLRDLATLGDRPLARLSRSLPVVPALLPPSDLLWHVRATGTHHHVLVGRPEGARGPAWRIAAIGTLIDVALVADAPVDAWALARDAHVIDGETAAERLPRCPAVDELWLVTGSGRPRVLTHDDLMAGLAECTRGDALQDGQPGAAGAEPIDLTEEAAPDAIVGGAEIRRGNPGTSQPRARGGRAARARLAADAHRAPTVSSPARASASDGAAGAAATGLDLTDEAADGRTEALR